MTQCERIKEYIFLNGSITTFEAFTELGITRLASRIHDLQEQGEPIIREKVRSKNRYGEPVTYTRYKIEV